MQQTPLVYAIDDHDSGANNANGNDESVFEANQAFRAVVPHFPLPPNHGMWQSFDVGHIKFLVTDTRSYLFTKNTDEANEAKTETYFGREQFHWIKQNLEEAAADSNVHGVVLFISQPWKSEREFPPGRTLHEK